MKFWSKSSLKTLTSLSPILRLPGREILEKHNIIVDNDLKLEADKSLAKHVIIFFLHTDSPNKVHNYSILTLRFLLFTQKIHCLKQFFIL